MIVLLCLFGVFKFRFILIAFISLFDRLYLIEDEKDVFTVGPGVNLKESFAFWQLFPCEEILLWAKNELIFGASILLFWWFFSEFSWIKVSSYTNKYLMWSFSWKTYLSCVYFIYWMLNSHFLSFVWLLIKVENYYSSLYWLCFLSNSSNVF